MRRSPRRNDPVKLLILVLAAVVAVAAPAAAQRADSANAALWLRGICPGTREVRIDTTDGERVRGYCAPVEATQLRVTLGTREQVVPFAEVESIWVLRRGSGRGAATGALIGALVVGGAGVLLSQGLCEFGGCLNETVMTGLAGGAAGAILGSVAGRGTQTWRRIYP